MKEKRPKVTVITTTYNQFKHLLQTIKSVLDQDYPDFEYIISDDGSEKFPQREIIEYIKTNNKNNINVTILSNAINVGTVRNFNKAYKLAQGDIIVNLSGGDAFFDRNVIRMIVDEMVKKQCDVLVTSRIVYHDEFIPDYFLPHYDERKIINTWDRKMQYKRFIMNRFLDMASGSAMYFTKEIIQEMGYFDETYKLWEDGPFIEKYLNKSKLDTKLDMISIWYETGGISSEKTEKISPALNEDVICFNSRDRLKHIDIFSLCEKRMIYFNNKMRTEKNKAKIRILYMPEWISTKILHIIREKRKKKDIEHIKQLGIKIPWFCK